MATGRNSTGSDYSPVSKETRVSARTRSKKTLAKPTQDFIYRRPSTLQDKLADIQWRVYLPFQFNCMEPVAPPASRDADLSGIIFYIAISHFSSFLLKKIERLPFIFLSRVSSCIKHPSRHASAHTFVIHSSDFNNESKQMHFLAWTHSTGVRDADREKSQDFEQPNLGFRERRVIYIYIYRTKKSEKRAEKLVFQSIRVKARNSGDSRRTRGHRSTMSRGR